MRLKAKTKAAAAAVAAFARRQPRACLMLAGTILVATGAAIVYIPAGIIVAGAVLLYDSYRREDEPAGAGPRGEDTSKS